MRRVLVTAIVAFVLSACESRPVASTPPPVVASSATPVVPSASAASTVAVVDAGVAPEAGPTSGSRAIDFVVVGRVVALGKEPGFWSGFGTAFQDVDYDVVQVVSGTGTLPPRIRVEQAVVADEPLARKDRPGLALKAGDMVQLELYVMTSPPPDHYRSYRASRWKR